MRFFCRITRLIQQFKRRNALKIKLQFLEAKEFKKAFMLYQDFGKANFKEFSIGFENYLKDRFLHNNNPEQFPLLRRSSSDDMRDDSKLHLPQLPEKIDLEDESSEANPGQIQIQIKEGEP